MPAQFAPDPYMRDLLSLSGKVALITGASRGIGRAAALTLAGAGADVALVARTRRDLDAVAEEVRARGRRAEVFPADLTSLSELYQAVEDTYTAFSQVDVLVSNAGISPIWKRATETAPDEWDAIMNTNARASFFMCAEVGKRMAEQGSGSIVTMASIASVRGTARMAAYGASKAAIAAFTRTLALEFAPHGIRVNAVAPGYVVTDMTAGLLAHPYWGEIIRREIPQGEPGKPEDVSSLVLYLASPASRYVTGQLFVVDGGYTAG